MTDTLRNMPRYIRQTDAFGWQGADGPNGPWRSITPPQSGTPWQPGSPMDDLRQASADVSGVEVLSPAAQAVLGAYYKGLEATSSDCASEEDALAAALRAAADQVVPVEAEIDPLKAWSIEDWNHMNATKYQREETRRQLLAIAAELEGAE